MTSAGLVAEAKSEELIIRAGSKDYNKGDGVRVGVSKIIAHKKYNKSSHEYDIAILKLQGCLAFSPSDIDEIAVSEKSSSDEDCLLTGWVDNNDSDNLHGQLQLKSVNVYRQSECERVDEVNITKRMFCTTGMTGFEEYIDFAAGSPLVVQGKLAGIKCFGFKCNYKRPDVFTDVTEFSKFIQKIIRRLS